MEYWKGKANGDNNSEQALNGKIFVGGFSQGCAVSLLYGLTTKQKLGGVIGYSGFLFTSFDFVNKSTN